MTNAEISYAVLSGIVLAFVMASVRWLWDLIRSAANQAYGGWED